ncbi:hypothetical protein EON64_19705 [archaeon]|nr:MAG: hypothetical protein EON64_19705 [archaeon]
MSTKSEGEVPVEAPVLTKEAVFDRPVQSPEDTAATEPVAVPPLAPVDATSDTDHNSAHDKPSAPEAAVVEEKAVDSVDALPVLESAVESVTDHMENITIFGNKSLDELHRIQAKRSHLSAGILFSDPSLMM